MTKLGDAKILGGIGSILLLIPGVSIVGYILILIASKYISDGLGDKSIFDDMLLAVIAGIVGVAAAAFIIFTGVVFAVATFTASAIGGLIVGLLIAWIGLIVSSIFLRRAYGKIATKLNVGTFRTAGTLYFIGAILTIILVGFLILFVAAIIQIVAFFSIQDVAMVSPMQQMTAPAAPVGIKFCSSCGTPLPLTATFCQKCGAEQPA